jgi:hypothetical protein
MGLTVRVQGGTNAGTRKPPPTGPPEEWFCDCRNFAGDLVLRPGTWVNCGRCGARRPGS